MRKIVVWLCLALVALAAYADNCTQYATRTNGSTNTEATGWFGTRELACQESRATRQAARDASGTSNQVMITWNIELARGIYYCHLYETAVSNVFVSEPWPRSVGRQRRLR